jgi:hypothetical protein
MAIAAATEDLAKSAKVENLHQELCSYRIHGVRAMILIRVKKDPKSVPLIVDSSVVCGNYYTTDILPIRNCTAYYFRACRKRYPRLHDYTS